jgi:ribosome assembly protein 1
MLHSICCVYGHRLTHDQDELEDLGELADKENVAKRYMDGVRRRKGLPVREMLVRDAEKQKTLKR